MVRIVYYDVVSLLLLIGLAVCSYTQTNNGRTVDQKVRLQRIVRSVKLESRDTFGATIVIALKMELRNEGSNGIIFLEQGLTQLPGVQLFQTSSDPFSKALLVSYLG